MRYFLRVFPYLWPYRRLAAGNVVLIVLSALVGLLSPWPLKVLVDNVLGKEPIPRWLHLLATLMGESKYSLLLLTVLAGLVLVLMENLLTVLSNYVSTCLEQKMVLDFRSDLFQHAQRLSLTYHDHRRSGGLIFAINAQAEAAAALVMAIPPLAHSLLILVGMFWITYRINPLLALLSLSIVPFLYYSVGYYTKHIQNKLYKVRAMEGESLSIVHEAISMIRVIVAFGRESYEHRRFREQGARTVDARVDVTVRQTLFSLVINMITATGTALVLGTGAYQALQGKLSIGQLLVVMSYIAAVYKPLEAISYAVGSLQEKFISLRVAFNLLDTQIDICDAPDAVDVPHLRGRVCYENVSFQYEGRKETLREISFDAMPGEVIGVVGQTGAGKTTLVSLLPRFYEAQEGRILIDGHDIRQMTLRSLRTQVSIVLQEPLLFSGTIADNIRYGRLEAGEEEVIAAAQAANAHEFIMRLSKQYQTELGERGVLLSGGERQRLCIARAFLRNAPILILDEPTSSIDSKTEAVILEALERLMEGRTTFMIAHRLSTLRRADKILVLERGRLVEQGAPEELLKRNGAYRQLYELQAGAHRRIKAARKPETVEDVEGIA